MQSVCSPTDTLLSTLTQGVSRWGHRIFENVPYGALTHLEGLDDGLFALSELHWETDFLLAKRYILFAKRADGSFIALYRQEGGLAVAMGRVLLDKGVTAHLEALPAGVQGALNDELAAWAEALRGAKFMP